MVVDVVLPAVLGLVLVRKAGVETWVERGSVSFGSFVRWGEEASVRASSRMRSCLISGKGHTSCDQSVSHSISSRDLCRLPRLRGQWDGYIPVTNLKGIVTRSSSSDMIAVLQSVIRGVRLAACSLLYAATDDEEGGSKCMMSSRDDIHGLFRAPRASATRATVHCHKPQTTTRYCG